MTCLWFRHFCIAALFVFGVGLVDAKPEPYEETEKRHSWLSLSRPAENTPSKQLSYANELRADGKLKKAGKQYRALAVTWPSSLEAAKAQLGYAQILEERKKYLKAFEAYQVLFDKYAGSFPYDEILERQFWIANHVLNTRKGKFLIFGGFKAPERAVPLFENIVKNAPRWERAPEAQYLVGKAYELGSQYELAVVSYMTTQQRYSQSPFAEKAAFGRAHCWYLISEEQPNDADALEQAWTAVILLQQTYPDSEFKEVADAYKKTLYRRRAEMAYQQAKFYDTIAHKPEAALRSYENFVKFFPNSEWTSLAEVRINELSKEVETTTHED